jgi:hypothetical protein
MSASPRAGLPLNDDIVDRILAFSYSLQDLISAVLTSKAFHDVYKVRPHSIKRKIAWNMIGDALPTAIRCIRWVDNDKDAFEGGEMLENDCLEGSPIVTNEELVKLKEMADIVAELENVFSRK